MADIRIVSGTAWLGFSGFGVQLKVFAKAPGASSVLLGYTTSDQPGNGVLGNGQLVSAPWYISTNGIGTYKVWAEHPDNAGVKSNEVEYYFDPDNYQGAGDPFDWNGDGVIQSSLLVPAKTFSVYGSIESTSAIDWLHLVVSTNSTCDVSKTNIRVCYNPPQCTSSGTQIDFNCHFAFRTNIGTTTFYAYARDHTCPPNGSQSNVVTLTGVVGTDESYDVGTLDIDI